MRRTGARSTSWTPRILDGRVRRTSASANDLGAAVGMLELPCIIKLCSLACTLLATGSKAFDYEFASRLFEAGDKAGEATLAFREGRQRDAVQTAVRDLRKRIEHDYGEWLATEFRGDPAGLADARAAILSLNFVLPRCLPRAEAVIEAKYDAAEIAGLVVRSAARGDEQFRDGTIGARLLHCVVQRAFEALQEDDAFCKATDIPFRREVLRGLEQIKRGQDALADRVAQLLAAFEAKGGTERVEAAGLERRAIITLTQRLKPELLDFEQALVELESAVGVALAVIARGARGTNLDEFVDSVLARVGEKTKAGDFDGGTRAVDDALAELDRREKVELAELERQKAEQRKAARRSRVALLELGVEQDILRRDAAGAARRVEAIVAVEAATDRPAWAPRYRERWDGFYRDGEEKGVNFSLLIAAELARRMIATALNQDERGLASNLLGTALARLGERESGTARLQEAVAAYRAALEEWTRERVPLDWAGAQSNLGSALMRLGERESGTARLEQAVVAFRAALEELTRERAPLQWAMTQNNLGLTLTTLGERESSTARLWEAVNAYCKALQEWTRERVPLNWAAAQNNLGIALRMLGERESGTARLRRAVAAFHSALQERTRERVPLDWAMTQSNLGTALRTLGERERGTARLEDAVTAFRAALQERMRERVPLLWAETQNNLGSALARLGERHRGTARLQEAVAAFRAALQERTREQVPFQWAATQNNLGNALTTLGERESGTERLEQAIAAYRAALEEWTREQVPLQWAAAQNGLGNALATLGGRESGTARLEQAVVAFDACLMVTASVWPPEWVSRVRARRDETRAEIGRRLAG